MVYRAYNRQVKYVKGVFFSETTKKLSYEANLRAKKPLQLIHHVICEPTAPTSFVKHHYFLTCFDDYTRKFWVYF